MACRSYKTALASSPTFNFQLKSNPIVDAPRSATSSSEKRKWKDWA